MLYPLKLTQRNGNYISAKLRRKELKSESLDFIYLCMYFIFGSPAAYGAPGPGISYEPQSKPKPQLWQCQILNPMCWAGDRTCVPSLPRCCLSCCVTAGAPRKSRF